MSRISKRFSEIFSGNRTALIPYFTAGDPNPDFAVDIMRSLVDSGADLIELGVPFSDPMADGKTIQSAHERALKHKTRLRDVLAMVAEFRQHDADTPVTLMSYLNPLESMGYGEFAKTAAEVGVDGVLAVDMPPEENECRMLFSKHGLEQIFLVSPNSPRERLKIIAEQASGYLYHVSLKGVTGSAIQDLSAVYRRLDAIRQDVQLPLVVGFGIRSPEDIRRLSKHCDGVVIGSALIDAMQECANGRNALLATVRRFMSRLKPACEEPQ